MRPPSPLVLPCHHLSVTIEEEIKQMMIKTMGLLLTTLALAGFARGVDSPETRRTLRGLTAVAVMVDLDASPGKPVEAAGISEGQLQTDTELSLRRSGITVTSNTTIAPTVGSWSSTSHAWQTMRLLTFTRAW